MALPCCPDAKYVVWSILFEYFKQGSNLIRQFIIISSSTWIIYVPYSFGYGLYNITAIIIA